jgi:pimeloyl-ACP methyl ester carboxylesterase
MPIAAVNGLQIDYEVLGDPSAPPLLLVMGLGMPAALWPDELLQALLDRGLRVIRFDNRDSGGSTRLAGARGMNVAGAILRALLRRPVPSPYDLDDMARDAAGLLDHIGIESAHVAGISMGGMIAQVLAARQPQRVRSLVSIMSSTGNPQRKIAFGKRWALQAILKPPPPAGDIEAMVQHLTRVFSVIGSPGYPIDPVAIRPHFERVARRGLYREGTERQLLAILGSGDRRAMLRQVTAPTLVVHGAADPLVPLAAGLDTANHIRGARMEVVPGMGHDIPMPLTTFMAARIAEHCRSARTAPPTAFPPPTVPGPPSPPA